MSDALKANRAKMDAVNAPSSILSDAENEEVFQLIGRRATTLSTTIAQVYMTTPQNQSRWSKRCVGVVCFVKDNPRRSYFIRVVDLVQKRIIWEQELYNQFKYLATKPYFHTFEADDCNAGLNFSNQREADHFRNKIDEKLNAKHQRKIERKTQGRKMAPAIPASGGNVLKPVNDNVPNTPPSNHQAEKAPIVVGNGNNNTLNRKQQKTGKKRRYNKGDIGTPMDFRHVGHIGWDPKGGIDLNNIDPQWQKLFDKVGVTESQLQDKETSQFIYDFVAKHGGIEQATLELDSQGLPGSSPPPPPSRSGESVIPPPPPARSAPPPPPPPSRSGYGGPPPPPPSRAAATMPPPPPSRGAPPPPPPPSRSAPPPPPLPNRSPSGVPPPNVPAPPPPPPPPPGAPPPGAPPMHAPAAHPMTTAAAEGDGEGRGALLDQIHKGAALKKVDSSQHNSSQPPDGRNSLLSDIRAGKKLKNVSPDDSDREDSTGGDDVGMVGALAKALADRSKHIQVSDDDDDDDEEDEFDDDDWSD